MEVNMEFCKFPDFVYVPIFTPLVFFVLSFLLVSGSGPVFILVPLPIISIVCVLVFVPFSGAEPKSELGKRLVKGFLFCYRSRSMFALPFIST